MDTFECKWVDCPLGQRWELYTDGGVLLGVIKELTDPDCDPEVRQFYWEARSTLLPKVYGEVGGLDEAKRQFDELLDWRESL